MQYRKDKKSGNELSALGYGCMRFPNSKEKTESLILRAYKSGVNYYDTAYIYPGSEVLLGEILEKHNIRKDIYLATKLPQSRCNTSESFDKYFEEQKKRLRTDYIDYYLLHNISDFRQWESLVALGIKDWIEEKKGNGEIKQIGFSFHGSQKDFFSMLDAYDWDFVQIQYNYINIHYQAGIEGLKKAAGKGIPVFIMEPLLGGKLANGLPKEALQVMKSAKPNASPVSWGLHWLWNQPEVTVVLSGMNESSQLKENLRLANNSSPCRFGQKEYDTIEKVIDIFNDTYKIRCTGCNYCIPCPKNINIPACFSAYNNSYTIGFMTGEMQYMTSTGVTGSHPHFASDCIGCGKCEQQCPQNIEIRNGLKAVKKRLELPGTRPISRIVRKIISH